MVHFSHYLPLLLCISQLHHQTGRGPLGKCMIFALSTWAIGWYWMVLDDIGGTLGNWMFFVFILDFFKYFLGPLGNWVIFFGQLDGICI